MMCSFTPNLAAMFAIENPCALSDNILLSSSGVVGFPAPFLAPPCDSLYLIAYLLLYLLCFQLLLHISSSLCRLL